MPMIVLEHSRNAKRFPNPFGFPPTYTLAALERAFHTAHLEHPDVVIEAVRAVAAKPR